jgi:hypothetical protein
MAVLTDNITEIARLIRTIPSFGTINESDMALMSYPSADITYVRGDIVGDDSLAQFGFEDVEIRIKLRVELNEAESNPQHEIDAAMDTVLDSVKTVLLANEGGFKLSNRTSYIAYRGFEKEMSKSGDVFVPGILITKWNLRYQN